MNENRRHTPRGGLGRRSFRRWIPPNLLLLYAIVAVRLDLLGRVSPQGGVWVVAPHGEGDFTTIGEALQSLPAYTGRVLIEIRDGVYEERVRIDRDQVTLRGQSREGTRIRYALRRAEWEARKDWIGPAVVNIHADDVILENLTIENTQPDIESHAFAVYGDGTRTILMHCDLLGRGGDTVALWNHRDGMYYLEDCRIEGAVDLLCPRGSCHVSHCRFFEVKPSATLWHDGHAHPSQKCVVVDSDFDGVPGFCLARHHYDAQFFFIRCRFSERMADRPVYRHQYPEPERNTLSFWGDRVYFFACRKAGKSFDWYRDRLPSGFEPEGVRPSWTFGGAWDPEAVRPLQVVGYEIAGRTLVLIFDEVVTVWGRLTLRNPEGKVFRLPLTRPIALDRLAVEAESPIVPSDLGGLWTCENGTVIGTTARVRERTLGPVFRILE